LRILLFLTALLITLAVACSSDNSADSENKPTLVIGGIPDQDLSRLEERFGGIANYLSETTGIDVEYSPVISYASLVTAFQNGDIQLSWFGGLTGVQARRATPGATAVLQRPLDTEFRSVFIVGSDLDASSLGDLSGASFTFGSESSTSGHLMPRFFLGQVGINPEDDFNGPPSYSGSHDTTWKLVEAGSFDAGALNAAVWDRAVTEGQVDTSKARVLQLTDPYFDYHWVAHPDIDTTYGEGSLERIRTALTDLDPSVPEEKKLLDLFDTDSFIQTEDANYQSIEETARELGLIR
jgi:phosphonate transport system substrate-binding protein